MLGLHALPAYRNGIATFTRTRNGSNLWPELDSDTLSSSGS
jgi:hypothetical protein